MAPKPTNWALYTKMAAAFFSISLGGPALIYWISPTEEELFKKYNPELQKRSLENRQGRQQDFDDFVGKLKVYSKSDRPIWEAAKEYEARAKSTKQTETGKLQAEMEKRKQEMRDDGIKLVPGGSL